MPVYIFLALLATGGALAQSRSTDPCYAYRPDELARLPPGVCAEVRGGGRRDEGERRPSPYGGRSEQRDDRSRGPGPSRPGATGVFDPIGEARARGLRSPHSAREHQAAVSLAQRYLRPAISRATSEIRRGERVAGPDAQIITEAKQVLEALRGARIVDGADGCAVNPDGEAFVSSTARNTIHVCPKLNTRTGRHRDKEVMFILVHEAVHLSGVSDENVADDMAGMILGWGMGG